MQDSSSRGRPLRVDLACGAVVAFCAAVLSVFMGMVLMYPVAIAIAAATALPIRLSLMITAAGLAIIPALFTACLLWRVARSDPFVNHVVRVSVCGCAIGSLVGQAIVCLLLQTSILSPS